MRRAPIVALAVLAACTAKKSQAPDGGASSGSAVATSTGSAPDVIDTSMGKLTITPLGHASILFEVAQKVIYVDPWSQARLEGRPKADVIFVTDIHPDHLDPAAIDKLRTDTTIVAGPKAVADQRANTVVVQSFEMKTVGGVSVLGVPMYNLKRGPSEGGLYHEKGRGTGFVFTFGDKRVYVAGDTECTEEMKALQDIDVAFLPMNLPYTMPPSEAAECARAFKPRILYPYHYRGSDLSELTRALADAKDRIEVRVRNWY